MAYDRFVAICHPLLYHAIMSKRLCIQLVVVAYTAGVFVSAPQTRNAFILPYCGPNVIDRFFCDIPPVLQLACSDTTVANVILLCLSALVTVPTVSAVLISYAFILVTICRMRSLEAQHKAFSTCASHLTASPSSTGLCSLSMSNPTLEVLQPITRASLCSTPL